LKQSEAHRGGNSPASLPVDHLLIEPGPDDRALFRALIAQARARPTGVPPLERLRAGAVALETTPAGRQFPAGVDMEAVETAGLSSCWFKPAERRRAAVVLYFHGGGYVCGSVTAARGIAGSLALAFGAPVLALGYRQSPEHPFPAALEDGQAGYRWLRAQSESDIFIVGDSAGGQLAMAVAARAARDGMPALGAISSSGWFDLDMAGPSWRTNRDTDLSDETLGRFFRASYIGQDPIPPGAMLQPEDIAALPPILVQAAGGEMALDDSTWLVASARRAGIATRYEVYDGLPHNFVKFRCDAGDLAISRMAAWAAEL